MTTEPVEEETRRLLAMAAATIDVDDSAPLTLTGLPEPTRRRWPVLLAAAAAVVVAIGGGTLVARELGSEGIDESSSRAGPVAGEVVLGDDQVPGLIGLRREEAVRLLEDRGYEVQVRRQPDGCSTAGIVTGSTPPVGTTIDPGDTVTIRVIAPEQVIDCVGELPWGPAWDLVRLARGLEVDPASLAGAEIPADALATLARLVTRDWPGNASPTLELATPDAACGLRTDDGSWDLRMWVAVPVDGVFCLDASLLIERDERGGIAEVAVDDSAAPPADPLEPAVHRERAANQFVSWARGDGPAPDFARRVRLLSAGFHPGWVDQPKDRSRYSGCSGLGFPDCGIDPVAAVFHAEGRVDAYAGRPACGSDGAYPRRYVEADEVHLAVADPDAGQCPSLVQLWISANGQIYRLAQVGLPHGQAG